MEYLITYGWAILVIVIVVAAFVALGIFNSNNLAPKAPPGSCSVYKPSGLGATFSPNLEGTCNGELPEYVAQFNGGVSYITIPYSPGLNNGKSYTIIAWVSTTSPGTNTIFTGGYTSGNFYELFMNSGGNAGFWSGIGYTVPGSANLINNGKWYQVVTELGASGASLYINGALTYTTGTSQPVQGSGGSEIATTCVSAGVCSSSFNGMIANVQVYNTSLSANDITTLYDEGIGGAPIALQWLAGWWPLNGNDNDYSGNNKNANTISNVIFTDSWSTGYTTP